MVCPKHFRAAMPKIVGGEIVPDSAAAPNVDAASGPTASCGLAEALGKTVCTSASKLAHERTLIPSPSSPVPPAAIGSLKVKVGVLFLVAALVSYLAVGPDGLTLVGMAAALYFLYAFCSSPSAAAPASASRVRCFLYACPSS